MNILELCSGTGSVGTAFKKLIKVNKYVSVDINPKYNPTTCQDIMKFEYKKYKPGTFDIIWASPPCTEYSLAKTIGVRNFQLADAIVRRVFLILSYLKPSYWFVENPVGLLQHRRFMHKYEQYKHKCSYCHYGTLFKKPTNIWTNVQTNLKHCSKETPCKHRVGNRHHVTSQAGYVHYSTKKGDIVVKKGAGSYKNVYPVPQKLIKEVCKSIYISKGYIL